MATSVGTDSGQGATSGRASRARVRSRLPRLPWAWCSSPSSCFGGDGGHQYNLLFQTGGQLVKGNQVLVAGQRRRHDRRHRPHRRRPGRRSRSRPTTPLREGTTAIIRTTSLSGDRKPLRLAHAGPEQLAGHPRRRHDHGRQDPVAGRSRPALQHLHAKARAPPCRRSSAGRRRSTPATRATPTGPTSTSLRACDVEPAPVRRARPRSGRAPAASSSAARRSSAPSPRATTTSPR